MDMTLKRRFLAISAVVLLCLSFPFFMNNRVRAIDSDDDAITDDEFKDSKVTITQGYMSYETKIKICWESLAGSSGYVIYTEQDGKTKNIATVDRMTLSYKLTGLKGGTTYTIGVKGYRRSGNSTIYTSSSVIKATTSPSKPMIKSFKVDSAKADISWKPVSCSKYALYYYNNGERALIKFINSDKTSTSLRRSCYPGLTGENGRCKIYLTAICKDEKGNTRESRASIKIAKTSIQVPYIEDVRKHGWLTDGIKILDGMKKGESNTKSIKCYMYTNGDASKKYSTHTINFTKADVAAVKKFEKDYFHKSWSDGEKIAFTLWWINMNSTYDKSYKYSGSHSLADVIFNYRYGQCLQYNGALVMMMNYLGYDAYLVARLGYRQHYRAFIDVNGEPYAMEVGADSRRWGFYFMEPNNDMAIYRNNS
ncbi:MAG: hypothetical protein J5778_09165 [Clostridiales bacterium]|nr:hypothetical protein [Clostridiales bacterium]